MQRGLEYQAAENLEAARDAFDRAITIKPDYAEAWNRRAVLFFNEGKYDEAIADLETAITARAPPFRRLDRPRNDLRVDRPAGCRPARLRKGAGNPSARLDAAMQGKKPPRPRHQRRPLCRPATHSPMHRESLPATQPSLDVLGRPGKSAPAKLPGDVHMDDGAAAAALTQAAKDKLKQTVMKIEKLEEEKKEVGGQIKDVYQEAKSMGYDTKALRARSSACARWTARSARKPKPSSTRICWRWARSSAWATGVLARRLFYSPLANRVKLRPCPSAKSTSAKPPRRFASCAAWPSARRKRARPLSPPGKKTSSKASRRALKNTGPPSAIPAKAALKKPSLPAPVPDHPRDREENPQAQDFHLAQPPMSTRKPTPRAPPSSAAAR
jgi:hypothetical protein